MSGTVTCPACGARNAAEARWCGQCYVPLEAAAAEAEPVATQAKPAPTAGSPPRSPEGEPVWICTMCETVNPIELSSCSACGTSIYASFGGGPEPTPNVDPGAALLRGLLFPGLGHFAVRLGPLGAAIGGLALLSVAFGILLMVSGMFPYGLSLVLVAVGLWVLAALDAYRMAGGAADEMVLRPRVLTVLVGVVVAVVILAVLSAQGSGGVE